MTRDDMTANASACKDCVRIAVVRQGGPRRNWDTASVASHE